MLSTLKPSHTIAVSLGRDALSLGVTIAQLAAALTPIPGLQIAVDSLVNIIKIADNVSSNKHTVCQLRDRCCTLLFALRDSASTFGTESMADAVCDAKDTLQKIQTRMDSWTKKNWFRALLCHNVIEDDIKQCQEDITSCLQRLKISSHMEIHAWQAQFKQNQRRDHEELVDLLNDLKVSAGQGSIERLVSFQSEQLAMQSEQLNLIMGVMQRSLPHYPIGDSRRDGLEANLYSIQKQTCSLLPEPNLERGEVKKMDPIPVKRESAYDTYEGLYLGRQKVWMKQLRSVNAGPKTLDRFHREAEIWNKLWAKDQEECNKNGTPRRILPFLGFCEDGPGYQYFVSPWQGNGTATEYLLAHPDTDRLKLIRGITQGLLMLHTMNPPVVHGGLNASSVTIDDWGNPLLSDFGIAKVIDDVQGLTTFSQSGVDDSIRWYAPELINGKRELSIRSDIYSLGMTILELITGKQPWDNVKRSGQIVLKVANGVRPDRPVAMQNDALWDLLCRCWAFDPSTRPSIFEVSAALELM